MSSVDRLRTWWQLRTGEDDTPLDGDMPAWFASLAFHLLLLVGLTVLGRGLPAREPDLFLAANNSSQEAPLDILPEEFVYSEIPQQDLGAASIDGTATAFALAPVISEVSQVSLPRFEGGPESAIDPISLQIDIAQTSGPHFSENLTVRGAAGVGTTGAVGAIDRITHEILLSLEERRTLVVWLFDQSGSLAQQRREIVERFDKIYEELGVIEAAGNPAFRKHDKKPLLSAVVTFGEKVSFLTPKPTDDVAEIKKQVESLRTDDSGIERVFTAVYQAVDRYRNFRQHEPRRNVLFVVFTDEVGDDEQGLDATINHCRKVEIPVYVVGVPAPFGRSEAMIKYVNPDPKFEKTVQWVPVRQGPESFMPEVLKLGFSSSGEWDEPMDSGFGPYSLTRLAYETGGIFFAVHPNRNERRPVRRDQTAPLSAQMTFFFDPEVMRSYRPDYCSIKQYQRLMVENKARGALVQAAQMTWVSALERPKTHFPKVSEAELVNQLTLAQRAAAVLEPRLDQLYRTLKVGEPDREKLSQPRWQAGFDLAMGRVLAAKVRTETYNAMLAKAKQGMKFKDPKNDTWELRPDNEISVGSALEKQADQAREYLNRVVANHQGTPWALLAQRELKEPLGWSWAESYSGVLAPRRDVAAAGGGGGGRRDDARRMLPRKPAPPPPPKL